MWLLAQTDGLGPGEVEAITETVRQVLQADQVSVVFLIIILFLIVGAVVTFVVLRTLSLLQDSIVQQNVAIGNNTRQTDVLEKQQVTLQSFATDLTQQTAFLEKVSVKMDESVEISKGILAGTTERNAIADAAVVEIKAVNVAVGALPALIEGSGNTVIENVVKQIMNEQSPLMVQMNRVENSLSQLEAGLRTLVTNVNSRLDTHDTLYKDLASSVRTALVNVTQFKEMLHTAEVKPEDPPSAQGEDDGSASDGPSGSG